MASRMRPWKARAPKVRLLQRFNRMSDIMRARVSTSYVIIFSRGETVFGFVDSNSTNAIDLLKRDHKEVEELFDQYEKAKDDADTAAKQELAVRICAALSVHAQIEEEIFYPAMRRRGEEARELVDEAAVEHQSMKDIIGRLESAPPDDPLYDAGVKVLSEYVKHHVKEEENELFPEAKSADIDLDALGLTMVKRKQELGNPRATSRVVNRKVSVGKRRPPRNT